MTTTTTTTDLVQDDDMQQHIEDDLTVAIIRHGTLVEVSWNQLTDAERRQIYVNLFNPCGIA